MTRTARRRALIVAGVLTVLAARAVEQRSDQQRDVDRMTDEQLDQVTDRLHELCKADGVC